MVSCFTSKPYSLFIHASFLFIFVNMKTPKSLFRLLLGASVLFMAAATGCGRSSVPDASTMQLISAYDLDSICQLLVVRGKETSSRAVLTALEKKGGKWRIVEGPDSVWVGRNGFATPGGKREGDGKTPQGIYALGRVFAYSQPEGVKMPLKVSDEMDKWVDDPKSPEYNTYVHGETSADSYENLRLKGDDYKFCQVIEYNTAPVVKGSGSAIFFHVAVGKPTAGCVAIQEEKIEGLLRWMDPAAKPHIILYAERE